MRRQDCVNKAILALFIVTFSFCAIPDVWTKKGEAGPIAGEWGECHAFIIGINSYEKWPRLKTFIDEDGQVTLAGVSASVIPPESDMRSYRDPTTGMEFLLLKGGCFDMGDTFGDGEADEKPVHEVCLKDFYLGKYEVTVGQFRQFIKDSGYRTEAEKGEGCYYWIGKEWKNDPKKNWRSPGFTQKDEHPVVCISYNDALAFIDWLAKKTGRTYRLPTEAEWEYAARSGGKKYKYSWGEGSPSGNIADLSAKEAFSDWLIWEGYDDGYVYTAPVGSFPPNELGIRDMTGNVWEWCSDWYGEKYYSESPKDNPRGPNSGQFRVVRGGSWANGPRNVRASNREGSEPLYRNDTIGFRLALSALQ